MTTYFVQKEGVYSHGVWWIGSDQEEGKAAAVKLSELDKDSYHDWVLYEFVPQEKTDQEPTHKEIMRTEKPGGNFRGSWR